MPTNQDLILELLKAHKEESNRRFDDLSNQVLLIGQDVTKLQEFKWTTKGKMGVMAGIAGIILASAFEYTRSFFK